MINYFLLFIQSVLCLFYIIGLLLKNKLQPVISRFLQMLSPLLSLSYIRKTMAIKNLLILFCCFCNN
jgi:hypothetical protein